MKSLAAAFWALSATLILAESAQVAADEIGESVVFGVRRDAAPFSYCVQKEEDCQEGGCAAKIDQPGCPYIEGYTVRLCQEIKARISQDHPSVQLSYKVVSTDKKDPDERFRQLEAGGISVLCGASTLSLARMRDHRNSLIVFVSGASVLHSRSTSSDSLASLAERKLGVLEGTTTEALLQSLNKNLEANRQFHIFPLKSHNDAQACLKSQELEDSEALSACPEGIDGYFADREILLWIVRQNELSKQYRVSDYYFTFEPYALYVADNNALLYEVNATLVELFGERRDDLDKILALSFGKAVRSDLLDSLFFSQRLPKE